MNIDNLLSSFTRLHSSQRVSLRFKEQDGIIGLIRLRGLIESNPNIRILDGENVAMAAVIMSQSWGGDMNRTYHVFGISSANQDFLREILRDVESVEVSDHGAKGLMSRRQKRRDDVSKEIFEQVLVPELLEEIRGWDLDITGYLDKLSDDTPSLEFRLTYNNAAVISITLDGFSGRMAIDGLWGNELYTHPEQLQRVIRNAMEHALEVMTT